MYFFFNDTATTEIYTLSLHDALPICRLDFAGSLIYTLNPGPGQRIPQSRGPVSRQESFGNGGVSHGPSNEDSCAAAGQRGARARLEQAAHPDLPRPPGGLRGGLARRGVALARDPPARGPDAPLGPGLRGERGGRSPGRRPPLLQGRRGEGGGPHARRLPGAPR